MNEDVAIIGLASTPKQEFAVNQEGLPLVMVRQKDSGVHYGYLESEENGNVTLLQARRVWYWKGAATISELATSGTRFPAECKFPETTPKIVIYGICEKIFVTAAAASSLAEVPVWKA